MELSTSIPIILAFGKTGVGKSYLLNLMVGSESGRKGPFAIGATSSSVTREPSFFNTNNAFRQGKSMIIIDTPGMYDTEDTNRTDKYEKPQSLRHIENISDFLSKHTSMKITAILLCISSTDRWTQIEQNIFDIIKQFVSDTIRILPIITRANSLDIDDIEIKRRSFETVKQNNSMGPLFMFGNNSDSPDCINFLTWIHALPTYTLPGFQNLDQGKKKFIYSKLDYLEREINQTSGGGGGGGCFPGRSKLLSDNGEILMNHIKIGDTIQTISNPSNLKPKSHKIVNFLHRQPEANTLILKLMINDTEYLECTLTHLIFTLRQGKAKPDYIHANQIKVGDHLLKVNLTEDEPTWKKITKIQEYEDKVGMYAPLSETGTLIVNQFLVSCYADIDDHYLADIAMKPLKLYSLSKLNIGSHEIQSNGVHPYASFLMKILNKLGISETIMKRKTRKQEKKRGKYPIKGLPLTSNV